ncbi:MAG: hypothetical protein V4553_07585 [Bacteroidota bacterium]
MENTFKNDEVLALTSGSYLIHDSSVTRFDIQLKDRILNIDVYFVSIDRNTKANVGLKISFVDVSEYSFYWDASRHFYNVERYKFLKSENGYYISLDPFDESQKLSNEDQEIILSKSIEAKFI